MTTQKQDGGPAFPSSNDITVGNAHTNVHSGMTLRDWFAGQALAGMWSNNDHLCIVKENASKAGHSFDERLSQNAYAIADAMIAERKRRDTP